MSDLPGRTPAHSSRELRRFPWQVRDSGQLLLVVAAGVWLVAAVAQTAAEGLKDPRIAIAFGALPHLAVGRPARVSGMAARLLCIACVAYIFRPLAGYSAVENNWGLAVT